MLKADNPLAAGAYEHLDDPDYKEWAEAVSEAEPILWSGRQMDAPQMIPAGSTQGLSLFVTSRVKAVPTMTNREDDWVWFTDPYSGTRMRVPQEAYDQIHRFITGRFMP